MSRALQTGGIGDRTAARGERQRWPAKRERARWNAAENTVHPAYLPIEPSKDVISREHLEIARERKRTKDLVQGLKSNYKVGLSFKENMSGFFNKKRVRKRTKEKVWEAIG